MTEALHWGREDDLVVLTLDAVGAGANTMTDVFKRELGCTIDRIATDRPAGVIIRSAKRSFFAGGDLQRMLGLGPGDRASVEAGNHRLKANLRRLESLGVPIVAAIDGAALGGGYELCLATHRRISTRAPAVRVGLPEITLGLIPGGGGIVRSVRLFGVVDALNRLLVRGTQYGADDALKLGLVDALVDDARDLLPAAKAWIRAHGEVRQRWDADDDEVPGGAPDLGAVREQLPQTAKRELDTGRYPHLDAVIEVAVASARLRVEEAMELETRRFAEVVVGQTAKNMIKSVFFDSRHVKGDRGRPAPPDAPAIERCLVIGAGMMGAGIALACAKAGIDTVLQDVTLESAQRGCDRAAAVLAAEVARGRRSQDEADAILARIVATDDREAAAGVDLVIEAVFEDPALKAQVLSAAERAASPTALLASNTSTLPISDLAEHVTRPDDFVGLHFFSPVDRMVLVEVISGRATSDATLGRALQFVKQIGKTPIVVNDSRGFFTSRVIRSFLNEGIAALLDGVAPEAIERASRRAGYPAPVLQLRDELNMRLTADIRDAERAAAAEAGLPYQEHPALVVIDRMLAVGRSGRADGAGFYDYADGRRVGLWNGLDALFGPFRADVDEEELQERLLVREAIEAARCLQEGVIASVADANVGSLLGIGFPAWTGGVLQYIDGYPGGVAGFVARAQHFAARHGDRFDPPQMLEEIARRGISLADAVA